MKTSVDEIREPFKTIIEQCKSVVEALGEKEDFHDFSGVVKGKNHLRYEDDRVRILKGIDNPSMHITSINPEREVTEVPVVYVDPENIVYRIHGYIHDLTDHLKDLVSTLD